MAYTKPNQTPKCMKNGGPVSMERQMAHGAVPHESFQKNTSPFAREPNQTHGAPMPKSKKGGGFAKEVGMTTIAKKK